MSLVASKRQAGLKKVGAVFGADRSEGPGGDCCWDGHPRVARDERAHYSNTLKQVLAREARTDRQATTG